MPGLAPPFGQQKQASAPALPTASNDFWSFASSLASLRSAEAGERFRAAHSKQRLLVVCLKPPSLRSAEACRRFRAAHSKQRLLVVCLKRPAALGRWRRLQRLAPHAGLKASRRQFASFLNVCIGLARPSVGWPCIRLGKGSFCAQKPMQSHAFALPYLRWARWHDPATAWFAPLNRSAFAHPSEGEAYLFRGEQKTRSVHA